MINFVVPIQFYISAGLALLCGVLAVWIFVRYVRTISIRYYSALIFGLSLIFAASALLLLPISSDALLLLVRIGHLTGVFAFSMLLMFSWYWPIPSRHMPKYPTLFWAIPLLFFSPYLLLSSTFVSGTELASGVVKELHGAGYVIFPAFVISYLAISIWNFSVKIKYLEANHAKLLRWFLILLVTSAIIGAVVDVLVPALTGDRVQLGIYASIVPMGFVAYIIFRGVKS